ncbi:MarR family winged helix-turn-helix transcriptional regulator [Salinispora arenicola]|uniref:MarR family transcriptional regulator n=1 Tax=Salinispora arenicola TaxID=168697 RepID=A0A542XLI1_SALAC|nr:MarR family transcriptional regulator [Salinispora arenicola]MCN0151759.1 MarR family transcriptional regulator [Salinispora arenicola]NIL42719.1 MarR family transcriptional regulator [Salinispora arenicola]TQL36503.1 MarR family transcriptional regulator [Salinispora arenicola]GIM83492.1 MarR family transcriptional regulator [Salinispora arenicola]
MSATETATDVDPVLVAVERAMTRIRRRQARRTLGRSAVKDQPQVDLHQIAVVDAVEEGPPPGQEGVTVGLVAERLDIDPSRASRVVAATIDNGYLRRVASQRDGRRICLELTARGVEAVQNAHQSRQAFYKRLFADWSARDQQEFARLLTKFIDSLAEEDVSR